MIPLVVDLSLYSGGSTEISPPDLRQCGQRISPENFHNLLSLASSPPLSSQVAAVNTSLNPAALEFVPGKPSHDTPPAITAVDQASVPSFAQVCTRIIEHNF